MGLDMTPIHLGQCQTSRVEPVHQVWFPLSATEEIRQRSRSACCKHDHTITVAICISPRTATSHAHLTYLGLLRRPFKQQQKQQQQM